MYNYNYNSYDSAIGGVVGGILAVVIVFALIALAVAVVYLIALWKIFKKAGKNGWEAIVPFYNQWVLVEIAGLNWWWFLILISGSILSLLNVTGLSALCSLATLVATFFCNFNLAKKFHKDTGFAVLMTLFGVILYPIIGFSKSYEYDNTVVVSPNGPIESNQSQTTVNNTQTTESSTKGNKFCTKCGTKVTGSEKFCTNCGNKLD